MKLAGQVPRYSVGDLESKIYDNVHHKEEASAVSGRELPQAASFFCSRYVRCTEMHIVVADEPAHPACCNLLVLRLHSTLSSAI